MKQLYSNFPLEKLAKRSFRAKKVGQKLAKTYLTAKEALKIKASSASYLKE